MISLVRQFYPLLLVLTILSISAPALSSTLSPERARHVIVLTVAELPVLNKTDISTLSVQAISNGELKPIPFQIDEMNQKSNFYYEGNEAPALGEVGLMDEKDELVFMYHDTGEKLGRQQPQSGTLLLELSFTENEQTRYAYLVSASSDRSEKKYVDFDVENHIVKSDFYSLEIDKKNLLNWKKLTYQTFSGEDNNIIDTLKVRISAELFAPWARISLDNNNLKPEIIGIKHGPVRTIVKMRTQVNIAGIPIPMAHLMMHYYFNEQHLSAPVLADLPALGVLLRVIDKPSVSVSIDFNQLDGAHVYTARGPDTGAVVDGITSVAEEQFDIAGVSGDFSDLSSIKLENNYLYMDSKRDYHILSLLHIFPESLNSDNPEMVQRSLSLFGEDLGVRYHDDETHRDKPEYFPGAFPEVGYDISLGYSTKDLDLSGRVEVRFAINLYFLDAIGPGGPAMFELQARNPPPFAYQAIDNSAIAGI